MVCRAKKKKKRLLASQVGRLYAFCFYNLKKKKYVEALHTIFWFLQTKQCIGEFSRLINSENKLHSSTTTNLKIKCLITQPTTTVAFCFYINEYK